MINKLILFTSIIIFSYCDTVEDKQIPFLQYNWEISTLQNLNIDEDKIEYAFQKAAELSYINSFLIIRNGKIAAEKYFNGYNKYSYFSIKSVSKSFLSSAIGIAIDQEIISPGDSLTKILNEYKPVITDNRFNNITIQHLINMKSGLDKDENIYMTMVESNNWLSTIFKTSIVNKPGEKFIYSTCGTHLLSAVLTKVSGLTSLEYLRDNLLSKMEIEINDWKRDPQGFYFGGNDMYFSTRNMAVLGLLYLNNGIINNKQIVPKRWVENSLEIHAGGTGAWGVMKNIGYGNLWWLGEIDNYKVFMALGHGGQFVLCVPELDLIIATNSYSEIWWDEANIQELAILDIIGNYIIPAVNL
ncbi:MAG: serine hydrolase [Melioribacteraceae bacterium]